MLAIVLSAGFGTRLGGLTREVAKGMLEVDGRPLLEHVVCRLAGQGFDRIAINLHFQASAIRSHFGDGSRFGIAISYSDEPELLGTAGGVKKISEIEEIDGPFLIHYGDVVTDQDFGEMLRTHREREALLTMLTHRRRESNSAVEVAPDGRVLRFLERPRPAERVGLRSDLVNSGIWLCSPELLDEIPSGRACDLPRDILPPLVDGGRVFAVPLTGYRCAVDSPERLEELRRAVSVGRYRPPWRAAPLPDGDRGD